MSPDNPNARIAAREAQRLLAEAAESREKLLHKPEGRPMTLPLETALLRHMHADTFRVEVSVTGPDVAGFFAATACVIDVVEGQGKSRSPTSALAYALEAVADQLLGMKR